MHINEAEGVEIITNFFGLSVPILFNDLKEKYRNKCKELHPDVGGSEESFKKMNESFMVLKELYESGSDIFNVESDLQIPSCTADGIPLSELGRGFGPNQNGVDCEGCNHHGYTLIRSSHLPHCDDCGGTSLKPREFTCRDCGGIGKFTQKHTKRVVPCRRCGGTGKFKHPYLKTICFSCFGTGIGMGKVTVITSAVKCGKCGGKGEILILNPVIPKGLLTSLKKSSCQIGS